MSRLKYKHDIVQDIILNIMKLSRILIKLPEFQKVVQDIILSWLRCNPVHHDIVQDAALICNPYGDMPISIRWLLDDLEINPQNDRLGINYTIFIL